MLSLCKSFVYYGKIHVHVWLLVRYWICIEKTITGSVKIHLRYMFTCICTVNRYTLYLILIRCGEELGYVGGDEEGKPCWSEVCSEGQD